MTDAEERELRRLVRRWRAKGGQRRTASDRLWPESKITAQYNNGYRWGFQDAADDLAAFLSEHKEKRRG